VKKVCEIIEHKYDRTANPFFVGAANIVPIFGNQQKFFLFIEKE